MLSYRHSYHAGNFADVLKHIVLIECLQHFIAKDKAFTYIDTHAGAGLYSLNTDHAQKLQEFRNGVGKLYHSTMPELKNYLNAVKQFNKSKEITHYPGSPLIAAQYLRQQDSGWLFELHSTDYEKLKNNCQASKRIRASQEDGFKNLLRLLPPPSRRALVLIDPSYEIKSDYEVLPKTVTAAYKKFPTGTYAIWYPVVQRQQVERMEKNLLKAGIKNIQCFELGLTKDSEERGMTSAGMIIINPPWTLITTMQQLLPKLSKLIATDNGNFRCEVFSAE